MMTGQTPIQTHLSLNPTRALRLETVLTLYLLRVLLSLYGLKNELGAYFVRSWKNNAWKVAPSCLPGY